MRRGRTARARALLAVALLAATLAGCGSEDSSSGDEPSPSSSEVTSRVLTADDLAPLEPTSTRDEDELQDGSPFWSCGGIEFRELVDQGLEAEGSYFVSSTEDWAVYSMLITVPDVPAEDALATMQEAHAACAAKGQTMPELELGEGRWGYRSEGEGTTDAMRGYAVVGEHELAQVTVFGLQGQEPPSDPSVEQLLDKAVERAGE